MILLEEAIISFCHGFLGIERYYIILKGAPPFAVRVIEEFLVIAKLLLFE